MEGGVVSSQAEKLFLDIHFTIRMKRIKPRILPIFKI